jgi:very-short-patch-repair endonuclease
MEGQDHTPQNEDLTAALRVWPEVEQELLADPELNELADAVRLAFRVEVGPGYPVGTEYVLLFDVEDPERRRAAAFVNQDHRLRPIAVGLLPGVLVGVEVRMVSERKPIEGEVCPRAMSSVPATPDLEELPNPDPPESNVPLVERDYYWLTPIEEPFYDALRETDLTFSVQPWIQHGDKRYRIDFMVFWNGRAVAVELDGHEGHKTKDQRQHDYERERWLQEHGLRVVRWTGSDVYADAKSCVRQLVTMLRGESAHA